MERRGQPHLLVDGWNIAHAWSDVSIHWREGPAAVAAALEARLRVLYNRAGREVTLVFDGRGPAEGGAPPAVGTGDGVCVVYTEAGVSADAYMERRVGEAGEPAAFVVATGDRALANAVFAMGAEVLSPRVLREEVERCEQAVLRSLPPSKEPLAENPFGELDGLFPENRKGS
ncbi:MAG: NYN domain-containing protein [Opitutales bacterium]|nr:NYN domain-containing protein [Opitutales bacterium]